jgi:hypothetical protein
MSADVGGAERAAGHLAEEVCRNGRRKDGRNANGRMAAEYSPHQVVETADEALAVDRAKRGQPSS